MSTRELSARLQALANRITPAMDDPKVAHRLYLLEPGIAQLEAVVAGLESKVIAEAEHRKSIAAEKEKRTPRKHGKSRPH